MSIEIQQTFQLHTDHFQFYLEDLGIEHDTSHLWHDRTEHLLQSLDGLLAIGTARWGLNTSITIQIQHQAPQDTDLTIWEHIREAHLRTISGNLRLTTPEGDPHQAPVIPITPGIYMVRVYYGNMSAVSDELAPEGADHYKLIVWPDLLSEGQTYDQSPGRSQYDQALCSGNHLSLARLPPNKGFQPTCCDRSDFDTRKHSNVFSV